MEQVQTKMLKQSQVSVACAEDTFSSALANTYTACSRHYFL